MKKEKKSVHAGWYINKFPKMNANKKMCGYYLFVNRIVGKKLWNQNSAKISFAASSYKISVLWDINGMIMYDL